MIRQVLALLVALNATWAGAAEPVRATLRADLSASHDFAAPLPADAAEALPGLCSAAQFRELASANRFVFDFEAWPAAPDKLGLSNVDFRFHLAEAGLTDQTVSLAANGPWPENHVLTRSPDAAGAGHVLAGLGNIGWGSMQTHSFRFERPVAAFGLVYRSPEAFVLRRFYWAGAAENGYAVSYTLTDGTIVNLGQRGAASGQLAANTPTFVGIVDRSGRGITDIRISAKGTSKGDQYLTLDDLAFVTMPRPAVAPVANLRGSHDFARSEGITKAPAQALPGITTLDDFRAVAGTHRFVYDFGTWPRAAADLGGASFQFAFDTRGQGAVGQKITVSAAAARQKPRLARLLLPNEDGAPTAVLSGLGDIGQAAGGSAEQTFTFERPVASFGVVYRSPAEFTLARGREVPVTYTLADGTMRRVDARTTLSTDRAMPAGVVAGGSRTFVGVADPSGRGIKSATFRVQGTAAGAQPIYIEGLAFALDGLPPGDWKLVWSDEFDGTRLDGTKWGTGYRFVDVINNELQGYVPENVVVRDGLCTIRVEKRECLNTDQYGHTRQKQAFASGAITTYEKFAQKYGYFEARVKMSSGAGTWPAFWLLPDRGAAVTKLDDRVGTGERAGGFGSEIDIFEFQPWWKTADGLFLSHSGCIWSYGPVTDKDPAPHSHGGYALDNNGYGPGLLRYPMATSQFHTYGLYWGPGRLVFYIDSKPVYYVDDDQHVPNVPEYILLNCALTGNGWGMGPDKKDPTMRQIEAGLPCAMVIDYVRVYSGAPEL
ncbi:MAG: glycoside hydrolase family 16 protein [Armatimonadetes bacterium]|nr:glycoside hydrolase family 16 protein [Armatimonadota bacterium]